MTEEKHTHPGLELMKKRKRLPVAKVIGYDGNVYYVLGTVIRTIKHVYGLSTEEKDIICNEIFDRVKSSNSYSEALAVMQEYTKFE